MNEYRRRAARTGDMRLIACCLVVACNRPAADPVQPAPSQRVVDIPAPDAQPPPAPRSIGARLAAWLDAHDIDGVAIAMSDHACNGETIATIGGETCVFVPELRCAKHTTPEATEDALCGPKRALVPAPAWAEPLATILAGSSIGATMFATGVIDLRIDSAVHLLVHRDDTWRSTIEPIADDGRRVRILRVLDAASLGHGAVIATVIDSYDGGSEMGESWDVLDILCARPDGLAPCGGMQIGQLTWTLAAEDRIKHPGGATSLRNRPHIEVVLEPAIGPLGTLTLTTTHDTRSRGFDIDSETLQSLAAIRRRAGTWRFDGTKLYQENP
jgi:hypothetical protein